VPAARYEYLFLLLIFGVAGLSILSRASLRAFQRPVFWISLIVFFFLATTIDLLAIHWNWWFWSPQKTCGLSLIGIPIEEFILFFLGHTISIALWETLGDVA
jgi:lycopene cyclase domain-containing protein